MEIKRIRTITLETFKTLNELNPNFMNDIFYLSPHLTHKKHNIFVHPRDIVTYGNKSVKSIGLYIWNS